MRNLPLLSLILGGSTSPQQESFPAPLAPLSLPVMGKKILFSLPEAPEIADPFKAQTLAQTIPKLSGR